MRSVFSGASRSKRECSESARRHITPPRGAISATLWVLHAELGGRGVDELTMRGRPAHAFRTLRIRRRRLTVAGQRDGQVANPLGQLEGPDRLRAGQLGLQKGSSHGRGECGVAAGTWKEF